jgi:S-formylglutathione hydrolase FrmB
MRAFVYAVPFLLLATAYSVASLRLRLPAGARTVAWCVAVAGMATACLASAVARDPQYLQVDMRSQVLTEFWQQPVSISAHVLLPDSYYKEPSRRYPVMYFIQGFDGYGDPNSAETLRWQKPMRKLHQEFIVIFLDGMFDGGHQEFADSATYGPWGKALTTEFIPQTESHFRAIDSPAARFVSGHSSGGWSALWLQITYPSVFGGEWSLSPDPVDFEDFLGDDLTVETPRNFYSTPYTILGMPMKEFVGYKDWSQRQFVSFESVFGPADSKQNPIPLFDRKTGVVDPAVAQYWEQHYDIATILRQHWATLGPQLAGKIHIFVGGADNFHLDSPVRLLKNELTELGSDAEIEIVPGANHWTIFNAHDGMRDYILQEATSDLNAVPRTGN